MEQRTDPNEWVTVDMAAKLTGMSMRTWRHRAQRERAQASHDGRRCLAVKDAPPHGRGRRIWWVHRSMDPRLTRCPSREVRDDRTRPALSAKYPQHQIDRALRRNHWLRRWRKEREAGTVTDQVAAERVVVEARGAKAKISVRSLQLWWGRYNRMGEDGQIVGIEGLIDRYVDGDNGDRARSPDAVQYFYELYHTQSRLSVRLCHEVTLREAKKGGWQWPASYAATLAWLRKHDDNSLTFLMREGRNKWARRYLPHVQIDYTRIEPGYLFVCDHSQLDLWCTYKGSQLRPWLTAIQDARSRCIAGWHVGPAPHQDAILTALRSAFSEWSIPQVMRIDNGLDFTSKPITGFTKRERDKLRRAFGAEWQSIARRAGHLVECQDSRWLGITGELGIELIYAIPYSPWSKGTMERWFATVHDRHDKLYATYCGNFVANRPECVKAIRRGYTDDQKRRLRREHGKEWKQVGSLKLVDQSAVPSLDDVRQRLGAWLDVYHRTEHRGQGMSGRTPLAVWGTATHLRRAAEEQLMFLCEVRGLYKVGANGVSLKVGQATLWYGAGSAALKRWIGRRVLIALNPEDISRCWAFTPERERRRFIARLDPNEYIAPHTCADDARAAIAEKMRERSIMHKASRSAARRTKRASQRINEHARARRAELLATGTDAGQPPLIVPVQTGFERLSKADRSDFEAVPYRPPDSGKLEDLLDDDEVCTTLDRDGGMEDLFDDEPTTDEPDDGLDGI